jgi:hypothetical protein
MNDELRSVFVGFRSRFTTVGLFTVGFYAHNFFDYYLIVDRLLLFKGANHAYARGAIFRLLLKNLDLICDYLKLLAN